MRIGVLTYYRVANFGANLQAISTYSYLRKSGHDPIFIHYMSRQLYEKTDGCYECDEQIKAHLDFIDSIIIEQTEICFTSDDINRVIKKYRIDAIIVGSDAVLQHHPLLSRIYLKGRRFRWHFYIEPVDDERMYPNLFCGVGINPTIKKVFMSVSSQNSEYKMFTPILKRSMRKSLHAYSYISIRDTWTQKMLKSITNINYPITPDPVFAFEKNVPDLVPKKNEIIKRFCLPENYVLVSFLNVRIPSIVVYELKSKFGDIPCVALPTPLGVRFDHNFDYEIPMPLNPMDWYALIKYSYAYIGNNMHPIVVALQNGVPCFSIDNYSNYNVLKRPKNDGSSKILDILRKFNLQGNHIVPYKRNTEGLSDVIFNAINVFPKESVLRTSALFYEEYEKMMKTILKTIIL